MTNLDSCLARSAPDLCEKIDEASARIRAERRVGLPKYKYPDHIVTAAMLGYMARHGTVFVVRHGRFVRGLDSQAASGKNIFGGGYLLSDKAAAEKAAIEKANAIPWGISERERVIIDMIGKEEAET